MTEEATVLSRCLYAVSRNGMIVSESGGASIVPWWSFTKTVIAAVALRLVQDGRLRLDEHLDRQLFSLRQLLQHRAGFADYGDLPEYQAAVRCGDEPWSETDLLDRVGGNHLRYSPETGWRYSNVGYLIARQQIERITGIDFQTALQSLLLSPLGVVGVGLASEPSDLVNVTMGTAAEYHPGWVYHGLLVGPVSSAAILLDRLIDTDFLAVAMREQMLRPYVVGGPIDDRPWKVAGYGLGVMSGESTDGHRVAGHTGGGPGSVIAVYRKTDSHASGSAAAFLVGGTQGQVERAAFELASCRMVKRSLQTRIQWTPLTR